MPRSPSATPASLGYMGYETFGEVLEAWEPKGGLKPVLDENHLPLISAYCNVNLTDPTKRCRRNRARRRFGRS